MRGEIVGEIRVGPLFVASTSKRIVCVRGTRLSRKAAIASSAWAIGPLSSADPRPYTSPFSTMPANGGCFHSAGAASCTSPDRRSCSAQALPEVRSIRSQQPFLHRDRRNLAAPQFPSAMTSAVPVRRCCRTQWDSESPRTPFPAADPHTARDRCARRGSSHRSG